MTIKNKLDNKSILFLEENGFALNNPQFTNRSEHRNKKVDHYAKSYDLIGLPRISCYFTYTKFPQARGIDVDYFYSVVTNGSFYIVFYLCKEYENHLKTIIKNIENIIDVIFHIREELLVLEITKNKKSKIDIYVVSPLGANTTPLVSVIE